LPFLASNALPFGEPALVLSLAIWDCGVLLLSQSYCIFITKVLLYQPMFRAQLTPTSQATECLESGLCSYSGMNPRRDAIHATWYPRSQPEGRPVNRLSESMDASGLD